MVAVECCQELALSGQVLAGNGRPRAYRDCSAHSRYMSIVSCSMLCGWPRIVEQLGAQV